uniref:Uncharacterized protein n=1 Tax=Setaria italica TaxID=4555 RepID=K4AHY3_SETIT
MCAVRPTAKISTRHMAVYLSETSFRPYPTSIKHCECSLGISNTECIMTFESRQR